MKSTDELQRAIDDLYQAFSSYELPLNVEMSPYRDPEEELGALRRKPLREVDAKELDPYARHALTTVGEVDLLKYALPRLLELVTQRSLLTDPEIVLNKLIYKDVDWRTWPEREQEAILAFLSAWWMSVLQSPADFFLDLQALEALGSIAQVVENLAPYLQIWESHPASTATDHLMHVVSLVCSELGGLLTTPAFWDEHPRQVEQLHRWLARPVVLDRLNRGLQAAWAREGELDELIDAYEQTIDRFETVLTPHPEG